MPAILGDGLNASQDLRVMAPDAGLRIDLAVRWVGDALELEWSDLGGNYLYAVEQSPDGQSWEQAPGDWPIAQRSWRDEAPVPPQRLYRIVGSTD